MKFKLKTKDGITLISLVVTIVILIILAGTSINLLLNENGIINYAKKSIDQYNQKQAREKLEIELLILCTNKNTIKEYNENKYIDSRLREKDFTVEGDIVIVDGWQFAIDRTVPKISEELEKISENTPFMPTILKLEKKVNRNQITIKIQLKNLEGSTISYSIKKDGDTQDIEKIENTVDLEHTFYNLQEGKNYIITIETTNEYGTLKRVVNVKTEASILVSNIILNKQFITLPINATKQLTYIIEPSNAADKTVIWESSDKSIAIVENGLITSKAVGTCILTCKSSDGGAIATCDISVLNVTGISTVEELKAINSNLLGDYMLLNDIVIDESWTSLATGADVYFRGTLDGDGYSIKNLNAPLFGKIRNATIKNIKLENVNIENESGDVGAVAKISEYKNEISNVSVTGKITSGTSIGGLVGQVMQTKAGVSDPITISNSYVRATIGNTSSNNMGGLIGRFGAYCRATINNCYYSGTITAKTNSGNIMLGTTTDCYYEANKHIDGTIIGLTKDEMAIKENFINWDFENTWVIKDGYPELKIFVEKE